MKGVRSALLEERKLRFLEERERSSLEGKVEGRRSALLEERERGSLEGEGKVLSAED